MTFIRGKHFQLRVLQESDDEARTWEKMAMGSELNHHLFTGSKPMRAIDIKKVWEKERLAGDVLFGVWVSDNPEMKYNTMIGTCGLHSHKELYRSWEFRIFVFDPFHVGKGTGENIVTETCKYAFNRLNAHRIWLGVSADNLRAVKCYLNAGFKVEGTLRDEVFYDGKYHDVLRMSVLEGEL